FVNTATTSNNETVRGYLAVQPVDFSAKNVKATLYTATGSYEAPVTSRVVNKGRAACLRFSDDFTPVNIEFADAEVKRICVEHWDTNGDGELSYKEAAAVTDLGDAFRASLKHPNVIITSFNELQYFKGLSTICDMAFQYFNSLSSIILPEGITRIGEDVLMGCSCLTSVIIPDSITSIGIGSFRKCSGLTSVAIPDGVTLIGSYAFNDCTSLTSIVIPDSVSNISVSFNGCSSLSLFQGKFASEDGKCLINNDGRLIAFAPYNLTSYTIPDNVTTIGAGAFFDCSGLTSIVIPDSVTTIGSSAFHGCSNLSSIVIPDSVSTIASYAFYGCSNLSSIVIPDSVTTIGSLAFYECSSLTSITIESPNPFSIDSHAFSNTNNCPIYVPNQSVEAYKTASGWSKYADRIFGIDVDGSVVGPDPQNPD
ncbi:MAG: leucine-rich repeat domain-containing protein, partial [Bacteroidales bacterium]|nr:leucine-rich repeat domain-containing protein [Bacteroidales bacterium]